MARSGISGIHDNEGVKPRIANTIAKAARTAPARTPAVMARIGDMRDLDARRLSTEEFQDEGDLGFRLASRRSRKTSPMFLGMPSGSGLRLPGGGAFMSR